MSFSHINDFQFSFAQKIFGELDMLVSCHSSPIFQPLPALSCKQNALFSSQLFNPKDFNSIFILCMNFQSNAFKEPITDV